MIIVHGLGKTFVESVALGLVLQHTRIGLAEKGLVKRVAETLGGLSHFLLDFIVHLGYFFLDKHVCAIAFLGVFIVNQGVVECVDMPRSLPDSRMHENSGIDTYYIFMKKRHGVPPIAFDVIFQFDTVLTIVVNS